MGARLAQYALGPWWSHLDPAPRCLLAYMASVTYDLPTKGLPAGRFFQGRPSLVLNYTGIDEKDPRYDAAERRVRRYISTLVEAGAIRIVKPGYRGQHAEYELLVDPMRTGQDLLPMETGDPS
ncbi:MAG: hypothetical protein HY829_10655 [Actinobacteria bacterium]|nr:hypothetical protein [Actinomycetota bacterium]